LLTSARVHGESLARSMDLRSLARTGVADELGVVQVNRMCGLRSSVGMHRGPTNRGIKIPGSTV
jgi:hypothetical protein